MKKRRHHEESWGTLKTMFILFPTLTLLFGNFSGHTEVKVGNPVNWAEVQTFNILLFKLNKVVQL